MKREGGSRDVAEQQDPEHVIPPVCVRLVEVEPVDGPPEPLFFEGIHESAWFDGEWVEVPHDPRYDRGPNSGPEDPVVVREDLPKRFLLILRDEGENAHGQREVGGDEPPRSPEPKQGPVENDQDPPAARELLLVLVHFDGLNVRSAVHTKGAGFNFVRVVLRFDFDVAHCDTVVVRPGSCLRLAVEGEADDGLLDRTTGVVGHSCDGGDSDLVVTVLAVVILLFFFEPQIHVLHFVFILFALFGRVKCQWHGL